MQSKLLQTLVPILGFFGLSAWQYISDYLVKGAFPQGWPALKAVLLAAFGSALYATLLHYRNPPQVEGDLKESDRRGEVARMVMVQKTKLFAVLLAVGLLGLSACASVQPSVKAICAVCQGVCPLVAGVGPAKASPAKVLACPASELIVINWKAVEKGAEAQLECKILK